MASRTSDHTAIRRFVIFAVLLMLVLSGAQAFAGNCGAAGARCGLPIVTLQSGSSDLFTAVRGANPSLYPSASQYHVFYDSRTGKVNFQDASGMSVTPDAAARDFVAVWHDGSSTDWRYIDATLAARVPVTAKADELAHILWAIKSATSTPRVILAGSNEDLAAAEFYISGKATAQFTGATHAYNNDIHGMFATDSSASVEAPKLAALGVSALMLNSATDQYGTKGGMTAASAVEIADGITAPSTGLRRGQSAQFTSKIGPVVWSVIEGPSAGRIDNNGVFTSYSSQGTAHIVAVSRANHGIVAVASIALTVPVGGPTVTTGGVTSITVAGATFHGTVNPNGASGTAGFEYSTSATFVPAADTTTVPVSGSVATPISVNQGSLVKATKYYVRAFYSDGTTHKTTFGSAVSFTVGNSFITADDASGVTSSDATMNASYNAGGVAGYIYFAYSTNNFATVEYTAHINVAGDFTTHAVTASLTKLQTATAYKYKAYFSQTGGGGPNQVSNTFSFSTKGIFIESDQPNWAVSITSHGATFPGKYGTGGGPAEVFIEISKSPTFAGGATVYNPFTVPAGTYTYQTVNITVNTLTRGTVYYFRYGIKNTENGFTYLYPFTRSFTTAP